MEAVGIRVYRLQSSLTTIVISPVWRRHNLRHCMVGSAEHPYIRVRQVKASCSGLRSLKRLNDRYRMFMRIWKWLYRGRKVTQVLDDGSWLFKKENLCIWKCHLSEVCVDSRSKGVVTSLHRSVQDLGTERRGSLLARATCPTVRCAQRFPHITVEKVLEGTRRTVATGGVECTG
jgi:hypothetical protein